MQYSININQRAVIENGFDLDLLDMAIFDFIIKFTQTEKCARITDGGAVYYMISHTLIIEQLPMLRIKTSNGILNRINKLIDAGLLERYPRMEQLKKSFYKIGPNASKIFFSQDAKDISQPPTNFGDNPQRNLGITPNENWGYQNNNISDNNITDNGDNAPAQGSLFPATTKNEGAEKKESKGTRERFCLFENSKFFDIDAFRAEFVNDEKYAGADFDYYYECIKNWSASSGAKKYDWIATARNWMLRDFNDGKLRKAKGAYGGLTQDDIDYLKLMQ